MQKTPKLWEYNGHYLYWCPGCGSGHSIPATLPPKQEKAWLFDGNFECPTFSPSVRHFYTIPKGEKNEDSEVTTCHYHIKKGKIEYCNDCKHALNGQAVPLQDIPKDYGFGE
jgi:hypothetical protein